MTKIINARLSFPSLFEKSVFEGKEGKYEATLLIDKKDLKTKAAIDQAIADVIKEAKIKVPSDKICVKDGDEIDLDGYEGNWSLKASNSRRPTVINRDKTPITANDGIIYSGCYVNAVIDFWVQNNNYGKRVNANLYGVQFLKDGERFGSGLGSVDVMDDFENLDESL